MKKLLLLAAVCLLLPQLAEAQAGCASTGWCQIYSGTDNSGQVFPVGFMSGSGWATIQYSTDTNTFFLWAGNLGGVNPENNSLWMWQALCPGNPTPTWCSTFPQLYTGAASTTAAVPTSVNFWTRVATNGTEFGQTNTNRNTLFLRENLTATTSTCGGTVYADDSCMHIATLNNKTLPTSMPTLFLPVGHVASNQTNINGVVEVGNEAIGFDTCTVDQSNPAPTLISGTVNVTNASATVTWASGTQFPYNAALTPVSPLVGNGIELGTSFYRVASVQSATQLTLVANYTGTTGTPAYTFDNDCVGGAGSGNGPSAGFLATDSDLYLWGWTGSARRSLKRGLRQTAGWSAAAPHVGGTTGGNTANAEPVHIGAANPALAATTVPVSGTNGSSPGDNSPAWNPDGDPNNASYMTGTDPLVTFDNNFRCIGGTAGGTTCSCGSGNSCSSATCTGTGGKCQAYVADSGWDAPGDRHAVGSLVTDEVRGRLWVVNGWEEAYYWPDTWSLCVSTPKSPYAAASGQATHAWDKCSANDVYTHQTADSTNTKGFERLPQSTNATRPNGLANSNPQPNSTCGSSCAAFSLYGGWGDYDTSLEQNAAVYDRFTDALFVFSGLPSGAADDLWVFCLSTPGHISDPAVTQVAFGCTNDALWLTWVHLTKYGTASNGCTSGGALNTANATANYCGGPGARGSARMLLVPSGQFTPTGHEVLAAFGGQNAHNQNCTGENEENPFCLLSTVAVYDPVGGTACNGSSCTAYNGGNWCNSYLTSNATQNNSAPNGGNGEWNSGATWCSSWTAGVFRLDTTTYLTGCATSPCSFQMQPANMPPRVLPGPVPSQPASGTTSPACPTGGPCLNQAWGFPNAVWDSTRNFVTLFMANNTAAWQNLGFYTWTPGTNTWSHLSVSGGPTYDATLPDKGTMGYDGAHDLYVYQMGGSTVVAGQGIYPQLWEMAGATLGSSPSTFSLTVTMDLQHGATGTASDNHSNSCSTASCVWTYNSGTSVTVTGTGTGGSTFAGFSGGTGNATGCSGVSPCTFTISQNSGVTATFTPPSAFTTILRPNMVKR